jgi:phage-related protein
MLKIAISAVTGLYNGVVQWLSNIPSKAQETGNKIVSTFKSIDLTQIGKDIIQGLFNGIGSMAKKVWDKANEIADGITSKIRKALDTHSPSRVMMGIGVNVGEGLRNGIHSMIGAVGSVAGYMAGAITDNMDMSGALGGVLGTSASIETTSILKHVIDLANVPDGIDENKLLSALLQIFKNPQVKRTIDRINMDNTFGTNRVLGAN